MYHEEIISVAKFKIHLFKKKSLSKIYSTLENDLKDLDCDLISPFELFKMLINSIMLVQKLFTYDYDKKFVLFYIFEKVIEDNVPQKDHHLIFSITKLLKEKYFDVYVSLLKYNFKHECCFKKRKMIMKRTQFYRL